MWKYKIFLLKIVFVVIVIVVIVIVIIVIVKMSGNMPSFQESFGEQLIDNIHLCVIDTTTRFDGFYSTLAEIHFWKQDENPLPTCWHLTFVLLIFN